NCGSADGIFGAKTETAVRKYRQANKLPVTGVADAATMGCLLGLK
ncbi:MAG: peptidoglycan-binding protein, partial [Oscillospiraceae bacterium]|nr:peptidoglycan-binding protein [Oscillospiraceae bacterium]MBQ7768077.1 peptidoglycan-binding protein [Oscillospiraceae bacterium]